MWLERKSLCCWPVVIDEEEEEEEEQLPACLPVLPGLSYLLVGLDETALRGVGSGGRSCSLQEVVAEDTKDGCWLADRHGRRW